MAIKKEVLDELLAGAEGRDVFGKDGLFDDLVRRQVSWDKLADLNRGGFLVSKDASPTRVRWDSHPMTYAPW